MSKDEKGPEAYVRQVLESTQRYTMDLLFENERLRKLVAAQQEEKQTFERQLEESRRASSSVEELRAELQTLEREKARIQAELEELQEELGRHRAEQGRLAEQVIDIEKESRRLAERFVQVEQQNSSLAHLYVASYRLHETLDRDEVLNTIREIVINLIGSEEFGVFEADGESSLRLIAEMGLDTERYRRLPADTGPIGQVFQTGRSFFGAPSGKDDSNAPPLVACIPLKLGNRVTGAIAIFRLLEHKSGLEPVDHEMFGLLATHAATALYCTSLHAQSADGGLH